MSRKAEVAFKVLKWIEAYKEENDGNSPTYEQIAESCGFTTQNAWSHVERLARYGVLRLDENRRIILDGIYTPPNRQ